MTSAGLASGWVRCPRRGSSPPGTRVVFAPEADAAPGEIPTTYEGLARDVEPGSTILLDDGLLSVEVEDVRGSRVTGVVRYGGLLKPNKGMNLPGVEVSAPAISERDAEEVGRAVAAGADYIAMSFVQRGEDVEALRRLVPSSVRIVAKIEKDTALRNIKGILRAADAIMVARGDLGVELALRGGATDPEAAHPGGQHSRQAGHHGHPDAGVDGSCAAADPGRGIGRRERHPRRDRRRDALGGDGRRFLPPGVGRGHGDGSPESWNSQPRGRSPAFDIAVGRRVEKTDRLLSDDDAAAMTTRTESAIAVAVCAAAELMHAPAIVCLTSSGFTARTVAAYRPSVPILAVTPEPETFRQLSLVWGVVPLLVQHFPNYDALLPVARQQLLSRGLASLGDRIVVTAGVPFDTPGTTNLLKVEAV